jgi:hypothetical protein
MSIRNVRFPEQAYSKQPSATSYDFRVLLDAESRRQLAPFGWVFGDEN